jgi:long-chain acyl-CoA synthetase
MSQVPAREAQTVPELFRFQVMHNPTGIAYQQFDVESDAWRSFTWSEMAALTARWRAVFEQEGLKAQDRVAIHLCNGIEWICFDQAAMLLGLVVVPLFVGDAAETTAHILKDSGARLLVTDSVSAWRALRSSGILKRIRRVVCVEADHSVDDDRVRLLAEWLPASGAQCPGRAQRVAPHELATLVYTSGTTGRPKGVMLSHHNMVSVAEAILERIPGTTDDVFLSYLPLAHIFERVVGYYVPLMIGATVVFARSAERLRQDLLIARPTILLVVPSVLDRIHDAIEMQASASPIRRRLLEWAVSIGLTCYEAARQGGDAGPVRRSANSLLRRLVGQRITSRLGGRVRVAVSGGAPLSKETARFFLGIGLPLIEGYGLTEASSAVSAADPGAYEPGSAGRPLEGIDIRIGDRDEILVRSPGNMLGYWQQDSETRHALRGGWLHTGDIGAIREGQLYIRGRLKETLVLSSGEKLSPTDLEAAITRDPLFAQAMVLGNNRPRPVALLVLDKAAWRSIAATLDLNPSDPDGLTTAELHRAVRDRLDERLRSFPRYAQIRAFHVTLEPWTTAQGLLTPTLKLKRDPLERRFAEEIQALYRQRSSITGET